MKTSKPVNAIVRSLCSSQAAIAPFGALLFEAAAYGTTEEKEIARSRILAFLDMLDTTDKVRAFCAHDYTSYLGYITMDGSKTFTAIDPVGTVAATRLCDIPIAPVYHEGFTEGCNYIPVLGYLLHYRPTLEFLRKVLTPELVDLIPQAVFNKAFVQFNRSGVGVSQKQILIIKSEIIGSRLPEYIKSRIVPTTGREIIYAKHRIQTDPKEI